MDVLGIFSSSQREYLRKRAEQRTTSVEDELRELVAREMDRGEDDPLDNIVGMCSGDGTVTGENFHEYLYGREERS
jgi:plasmid stability protein